ncbi:MAG: hypothetical protein ACREEQ_03110, partial [Caulobacteraceae bacterium]
VYGLREDAGVLKLSLARSAAAIPLVLADDGRLVCPATSIGEISVTLKNGAAEVRFGGETFRYEKLEAGADADAFALDARGRYASHDADTEATIENDGERLVLSLSDGLGRVTAPLEVLSSEVAVTRPRGALSGNPATLSLDRGGRAVTGFRVNTARTRNLEFHRL